MKDEIEHPKREPFFGDGALEWGVYIASFAIVATAVHFAKLLFHH